MFWFWTEFAAYPPVIGTLSAASIRQNPLRFTRGIALNYLSEGQIVDWRNAPNPSVRGGDDLSFTAYEADEAGVAHYVGGVVVVTNAPIPISPPPGIVANKVHRCTVGASDAAAWSTLQLTEQDPLPPGDYLMLGARVESATAVAARFLMRGIEPRPAVIPVTRSQDNLHPFSRFWGMPIKFTMPDGLPQLEILTTAAETAGDVSLFIYDPVLAKQGVGRG